MSSTEYRELDRVKWNSYMEYRSGGRLSPCAVSFSEYREPNSVRWNSYMKYRTLAKVLTGIIAHFALAPDLRDSEVK